MGSISLLEVAPTCRWHCDRDRCSSCGAAGRQNDRALARAPDKLVGSATAALWGGLWCRIDWITINPVLRRGDTGALFDSDSSRGAPDGDRKVVANVGAVPV